MKTSSEDAYGLKKILAEAGLEKDGGAERVLSELFRTPGVGSAGEPPPGYENRLIAALNAKLPEPKKARVREQRTSWLHISGLAWGLGGVAMAALVFSLGGQLTGTPGGPQESILVQTARKDPAGVANWLASIGGSRGRRAALNADLDLSGEDPAAVDQALKDVARQMGMGLKK